MNYKGFELPKDIYIFLLLPFRIISVKNKLKKTGFNKLLLNYEKNNYTIAPDKNFTLKLKKFYKATSFFLQKVFRDSNPCMTRSVILYDLCCSRKIKAKLKIGVSKDMNNFIGHSWLEINGKPLCEDENNLKKFVIISEV